MRRWSWDSKNDWYRSLSSAAFTRPVYPREIPRPAPLKAPSGARGCGWKGLQKLQLHAPTRVCAEKGQRMDVAELVGEAREREQRPMPVRERMVAGGIALAFGLGAAVIALTVPTNREVDP